MIEFNITLLYQIVGFAVLYVVLNALLYKPVVKILEERDRNISGKKQEAEALETELRRKLQDYENRISEARAKGHEERQRLKQAGLDSEQDLLERARKSYQDTLSDARGELVKDVKAALAQLTEESKGISKDIAGKIMGRKVA